MPCAAKMYLHSIIITSQARFVNERRVIDLIYSLL